MYSEFYMIVWSGGYEPPQIEFHASFKGVKSVFADWNEDVSEMESVEVWYVTREYNTFSQELVQCKDGKLVQPRPNKPSDAPPSWPGPL